MDAATLNVPGIQPYEGRGAAWEVNQRNVTVDNFFSSYGLAQQLRNRNMTLLGTIRKTARKIPPAFREERGRQAYSSMFFFSNIVTLVSFKARATRKLVLALSSFHHNNLIDTTIP